MVFQFIKKVINNESTTVPAKLLSLLTLAALLCFFFGIAFYFAERSAQEGLSIWDSIWWSMVTMTTVGYGDYYAQTWTGRFIVSFPCFIIGISLIGYILGVVVEALIDVTSKKRKGTVKSRMKNHIIICHCPSESKILSICEEIRATDGFKEIPICVVAESLEEKPTAFKQRNIDFVKGNPAEEEFLEQANVHHATGVVVLAKHPGEARSDASSFTIVTIVELLSQQLQRSIKTIAEVINPKNQKLFNSSQVDGMVTVEGITDKMIVQEFLHPGIQDTFQQLLTNTSGSQLYSCETELVGRKLVNIQSAALDHESDLQIIGLIRDKEQMLNPSKQITINEGDKLIVLAETAEQFKKFELDIRK